MKKTIELIASLKIFNEQLLKFLIVGGCATMIQFVIFYILYRFFDWYYLFASSVGFVIAFLFGYSLNKIWTYQIVQTDKKYFFKYLTLILISLSVGLLVLKLLVVILAINPILANVFMICVTTVINFLGTKFWVFKTNE